MKATSKDTCCSQILSAALYAPFSKILSRKYFSYWEPWIVYPLVHLHEIWQQSVSWDNKNKRDYFLRQNILWMNPKKYVFPKLLIRFRWQWKNEFRVKNDLCQIIIIFKHSIWFECLKYIQNAAINCLLFQESYSW